MPTKNPKFTLGKETFHERFAKWARMNLGVDVYIQGYPYDVMLWLRLGCGAQTMLSHGDVDRAVAEAEAKLDELKAKLRADAAKLKSRYPNTGDKAR